MSHAFAFIYPKYQTMFHKIGKSQPQDFVKNTLSSTYCAKAEPSATQTLVPSLALLELFSPAFKNKGSDSQ